MGGVIQSFYLRSARDLGEWHRTVPVNVGT